jgi:acyl-CoA reductase-like NAD-dependent aldehyde dehydrogenase
MKISKIIKNTNLLKKIFPYNPTDFQTIDPVNNKFIKRYDSDTKDKIKEKIENSQKSFQEWRKKNIDQRLEKFKNLATNLEKNKDELSKIITLEMVNKIILKT